jgi:subtilisin family serine protease
MYALEGLADLGKNLMDPRADISPQAAEKVSGLVDRLITRMQKVQLNASPRMNNHWQKLYAEAIGHLGGQEKLVKLMETSQDGVLNRAIANGLIKNSQSLDNPKVAQFLLVNAMGLSELHAKGIDGKGTEVAIIDGDYINDDIEGLQGKVVYPEWGNTKDAALRESFHGESVASVMVGRKANTTYGIAPGVDKIYSYAAWDDNQSADRNTPIEEADGMLRSIDDIITKKISGRSKVSVVNMSLGGTAGLLYADEEGAKQYLDKLAARFEAGSKAGITFVISAGNEGGDTMRHHLVGTLNLLGFNKQNGKLVQSNGVILVGASDTQGSQDRSKHTVSWFSSVGDVFNSSQPDVMAPGTNIPLVNREANGVMNMDEMDGTSFSAPIVTGIALLMNQAAGKPLETEKLKEILKNNTYKLEDTPQFQQGAGGVDPAKAVDAARKERVSASFGEFLNSIGSLFGPDAKKEALAAPPKK